MKFQIALLLATLTTTLHSEDLIISSGPQNELVMTSSSCENLIKVESALCEWKKKVDPTFVVSNSISKTCSRISNNKFKKSISNCLPDLAKAYHSKKMINEGPNCWGTAMSFKKLSLKPRFMWPEEMMYWMDDSKLCRKLAPNEKPLPGDIINVYAPEKMDAHERTQRDAGSKFWEVLYNNRLTKPEGDFGGTDYTGFHRLLHSVTYISDELAFGKDSPSKLDRFYFHNLNEVYGRPSGEAEIDCQENQTLSPYIREYQNPPKKIKGSKCSYFSLAYRCENFSEYFNGSNLKDLNLESWKRIQNLQSIQEKLFPSIFSAKSIDKKEIASMIALVDQTVSNRAEELRQKPRDKNREMLLTLEYFTAAGIRQTLEQLGLVKVN